MATVPSPASDPTPLRLMPLRRLLALFVTACSSVSCDSPTGPSRDLNDLLMRRPVELRIGFVPTDIPQGHWLTAADTVYVRLTLELGPEYRDEPVPIPSGSIRGSVRYEGVPLWPKSEREAGLYEGSFFGTSGPTFSVMVALQESRPGSTEFFTLGLTPAQGLPSWAVLWYESGKPDVRTHGVALVQ